MHGGAVTLLLDALRRAIFNLSDWFVLNAWNTGACTSTYTKLGNSGVGIRVLVPLVQYQAVVAPSIGYSWRANKLASGSMLVPEVCRELRYEREVHLSSLLRLEYLEQYQMLILVPAHTAYLSSQHTSRTEIPPDTSLCRL